MRNITASLPLKLSLTVLLLVPQVLLYAGEVKPPFQSKLTSGVSFQCSDSGLQHLFDAAEAGLARNIIECGRMRVIKEGGGYASGVYLESAPHGGLVYASRDPQIALNHQVAFILRPREDGRISAAVFSREHYAKHGGTDSQPLKEMIWFPDLELLATYQSLAHNWDLPHTGWKIYFWVGRNREYLKRLYAVVEAYDAHLWKTRDSNGDGLLEVWCNYDTGEDKSSRYIKRNAPTRWPFDQPPGSPGMPDPQDPESFKSYWIYLSSEKLPAPRLEDIKVPFASMDLMAWSYEGRIALSQMARELGNGLEDYWKQKAEQVRQKVIKSLWVPEKHACFDRDKDGNILPELIHNNLRAMHHGLFTQEMADAFIREHLLNPQEFWTYAPLPCIAVNEKLFENDPFNNWSGQPEGLTYERSVGALENYGHYAEVSLIGVKLFQIIEQNGFVFPQQFDPFTGKASKAGYYSPMMFATIDYVSRLYGIALDPEKEQVWWSVAEVGKDFNYTQRWGKRAWSMVSNKGQIRGLLDGQEIFTCTSGVRIVTNLDGKVQEVVGISPQKQNVTLQSGKRHWQLSVAPNQRWGVNRDKPYLISEVPFDYPYQAGKVSR